MKDFEQNIRDQVVGIGRSDIPSAERDVLRVLYQRWQRGEGKITQRELADAVPDLGRHQREKVPTEETTLRKIRQVVRDLRVLRWAPVISDGDGYWIPRNEAEAREYIERMEAEVKARVAASFETYRAMRESLGITSNFLDRQERLMNLPLSATATSASVAGKTYQLYRVVGQGWICNCPGFKYRGRCRHADEEARAPIPVRTEANV